MGGVSGWGATSASSCWRGPWSTLLTVVSQDLLELCEGALVRCGGGFGFCFGISLQFGHGIQICREGKDAGAEA